MPKDQILISEIFGPTLQGEGVLAGCPTVFVRTGGCEYRCSFCDTMHAVDVQHKKNWKPMMPGEIHHKVVKLTQGTPILVTISGGNPALQPLADLLDIGHRGGYSFAMETQGSIAKPWFRKLDHLILSPKPPSSGMPFRPSRLQECIDISGALSPFNPNEEREPPMVSLKVVVMSEEDYDFARHIYDAFAAPNSIPFFITPGNHTPPMGAQYNQEGHEFDLAGVMARTRWIVERISQDRWYDVSVIPQLHAIIWPGESAR